MIQTSYIMLMFIMYLKNSVYLEEATPEIPLPSQHYNAMQGHILVDLYHIWKCFLIKALYGYDALV